MKSEELQRLTASEPLTLEQEYAMQRSWREDADSEERGPWAGLVVGGRTPEAVSRAPPVLTASSSPSEGVETLWKALREKPETLILSYPLKLFPLADASVFFPTHCARLGRM